MGIFRSGNAVTKAPARLIIGAGLIAAATYLGCPTIGYRETKEQAKSPAQLYGPNFPRDNNGFTVPAGAGYAVSFNGLHLDCKDGPPQNSTNSKILLEGTTLKFGNFQVRGLVDKGVEVTVDGKSIHAFMSYNTRCIFSQFAQPLLDIYNPGAGSSQNNIMVRELSKK